MKKKDTVNSNMGLIKSIAEKYLHYGVPYEELLKEGVNAVIKAAEKFEQGRNASFSDFASYFIKGSILEYLRSKNLLKNVSGEVFPEKTAENNEIKKRIVPPEDFPEIERFVIELHFNREMTFKEIAAKLNVSRERVRQAKMKAIRRLKSRGIFLTDN